MEALGKTLTLILFCSASGSTCVVSNPCYSQVCESRCGSFQWLPYAKVTFAVPSGCCKHHQLAHDHDDRKVVECHGDSDILVTTRTTMTTTGSSRTTTTTTTVAPPQQRLLHHLQARLLAARVPRDKRQNIAEDSTSDSGSRIYAPPPVSSPQYKPCGDCCA
ncbi:hypothetical protein BJ742DRAFT_460466 [Cladochytrium replicatum]|nr:hypothetical protein BJ742DRAFT_460466 [Cladochytrium replicatum]